MSRRASWCCCLCLLLAPLLLGCSKNNQGRKPVHGTITLGDKPVQEGRILFEPVGDHTEKISSGALIQNGDYEVPEEKGLPAGEYLVRINAYEPGEPGSEGGGDEDEMDLDLKPTVDLIPEEYNNKSDKKITVTEDGENEFNFDIPAS